MEMMNINELHYFIGAMGFGLFFITGLCTLFNHGWRFPYKWYVAILFYCGLTFAVNTPVFDTLCAASGRLNLLRDVFNMGLAPVTMLAVCMFARLSMVWMLLTQLIAWIGSLGLVLAYHLVIPHRVGYLFLVLLAVAAAVWCVKCCASFLDGQDASYLHVADKRWFALFSLIVALLTLAPLAARLAMPFLHLERLILVGDSLTFFPLLLFFQYRHGDLVFNNTEILKG